MTGPYPRETGPARRETSAGGVACWTDGDTAIDLNTGDHVWMKPLGAAPREVREHPDLHFLPANPTAPPMSYMLDGRQYIAVAAATLETPAEIIALALP